LRAVVAGLAVGSVVGVPAVIVLLRTLPNVEHAEPWSVAPALVALTIVAAVAAAIPAARATSLDPALTLRAE
jgi:ABC-type antimicrobial peptide transport system permease subunit